jgi:copper resistance protein C
MIKSLNRFILAMAAALLWTSGAYAHPVLTETSPPANATIMGSPAEIHLSFSEALIVKFSGIELKDESGKRIETGAPVTGLNAKNHLVIPVKATLLPGTYIVDWHAVSEDTHRVKGNYRFRIGQ